MTFNQCYKLTKQIFKNQKRLMRLLKIRKLLLDEVKCAIDDNTEQQKYNAQKLMDIEATLNTYYNVVEENHNKLLKDNGIK